MKEPSPELPSTGHAQVEDAPDELGELDAEAGTKQPANASSITPPERDVKVAKVDGFRKLDARSEGLSRLTSAIGFSVVAVVALVAGIALFWVLPFPAQLLILLVWLFLIGLGVLRVYSWPRWEHDGWSYRVGDNVLELRYGVVWHVSVLIPLSRMQHVDLHRGPLERKWGLASLEIHTAGTRDASHRIPGLDVSIAGMLRDQLIDAAKRGSHVPAED